LRLFRLSQNVVGREISCFVFRISPVSALYICRESSTNRLFIMQNEPNFEKAQMNVTKVITKDYENKSNWTLGENEPKTNPIKANFTSAQRRRTAVQRIKNPLQLPFQISRLSKRPCYKSLKKVKKIKCPTLKRF